MSGLAVALAVAAGLAGAVHAAVMGELGERVGIFPALAFSGVVAVVIGVLYWFVLARTRFGFDLKATGLSESAAVASGVSVKKMVLASMLLSGAVAGLVGMPELRIVHPAG